MQSAKALQASKIANASSVTEQQVKIPELYDIKRDVDSLPESVMEFLLFEQVGGQELLLLSRTDMLSGQDVAYQPIKNLNDIASQYSSGNILSIPGVLPETFKQYGIVLENYVPSEDPLDPSNKSPWLNGYIEDIIVSSNNANEIQTIKALVIEFQNMQPNMSVSLEIMQSGDTDYTAHGLS